MPLLARGPGEKQRPRSPVRAPVRAGSFPVNGSLTPSKERPVETVPPAPEPLPLPHARRRSAPTCSGSARRSTPRPRSRRTGSPSSSRPTCAGSRIPSGNHVARITFAAGAARERFDVLVELAVDVRPVNPFDFFVDDRAEPFPFDYPAGDASTTSRRTSTTAIPSYARRPALRGVPRRAAPRRARPSTFIVALNHAVNQRIRYVIREESRRLDARADARRGPRELPRLGGAARRRPAIAAGSRRASSAATSCSSPTRA